MINKKLLASTALAGLLATSNAFSQTTNFAGPSLALSGSYVGGSSAFKTGETFGLLSGGDGIDSKFGDQTNVIPGVDLNYGFAMGNNFVLGLGATYDFSKTKTGGFTSNYFINGEDATFTIDSNLKNHYSLYIQPTYVINKDSAMFAKVGRHYAKSSVKSAGGFIFTEEGSSYLVGLLGDDKTVSKNIEGWGFGLGLKTFLTSNLFVQLEGGIVEYDKINLPFSFDVVESGIVLDNTGSHKIKTTNAMVSVGYKF
jgi:opacity protein-like surface antigen